MHSEWLPPWLKNLTRPFLLIRIQAAAPPFSVPHAFTLSTVKSLRVPFTTSLSSESLSVLFCHVKVLCIECSPTRARTSIQLSKRGRVPRASMIIIRPHKALTIIVDDLKRTGQGNLRKADKYERGSSGPHPRKNPFTQRFQWNCKGRRDDSCLHPQGNMLSIYSASITVRV